MNKIQKNYSCILLLTESLTESEFRAVIYNYAKFFKKLGLKQISVFAPDWMSMYKIKNELDPIYIEFKFSSPGKALETISRKLHLDPAILRFFIKRAS